jgi:hypothetical protein
MGVSCSFIGTFPGKEGRRQVLAGPTPSSQTVGSLLRAPGQLCQLENDLSKAPILLIFISLEMYFCQLIYFVNFPIPRPKKCQIGYRWIPQTTLMNSFAWEFYYGQHNVLKSYIYYKCKIMSHPMWHFECYAECHYLSGIITVSVCSVSYCQVLMLCWVNYAMSLCCLSLWRVSWSQFFCFTLQKTRN